MWSASDDRPSKGPEDRIADFSRRPATSMPMHKVEVEFRHIFTPLMDEHGAGISLLRTIELPFVPTSELAVYSREFDPTPVPVGLVLKEIVWDMDRQVFLAKSSLIDSGLPIAMIPHELKSWIDLGWRFGSHDETYDPEPSEKPTNLPSLAPPEIEDDEVMDRWPMERPAKRPAEFNLLLKAMVRTMAELFNNSDVAYAVYKTQMFFSEEQLKENRSAATDRWRKAWSDFHDLASEQQLAWRDRVMRRHPHIVQFVAGA